MVASQLARGEKEHMVIRNLCETLIKTGSRCHAQETYFFVPEALMPDKIS
jgi:hypothetical protein